MGPAHYKKLPKRSIWDMLATGVLVGAFGGFLIVAGMYVIVRERYTYIRDMDAQGNIVIPESILEEGIRTIPQQDCYINASCEYGLWFSRHDIQSALLKMFPRIERVEVNYKDNKLIAEITERVAAFRFCSDSTLTNCYLGDNDGIVFEKSAMLSDLRYIPTIYPDTTKIRVDITDSMLPVRLWNSNELAEYRELSSLLEPYARIYHITYSRRDMNVRLDKLYDYLIADGTAVLKFNRESLGDPERVMYMSASLDRLISFQPFASKFKLRPDSLEYLDLRFPKRLYMKFREESSLEGLHQSQ